MSGGRQLSGLQKQVLSLYKRCLKEAARKEDKVASREFVRSEFRSNAKSIKEKEFQRIEFFIRKGEKQLKLLSSPSVKGVGVSRSGSS